MRGSPSPKCTHVIGSHAQAFCAQFQNKERGSIGHVAHNIFRITPEHSTGIVASVIFTIIDHVAFIRCDHHSIIIGSESSDQGVQLSST